MKNIEVMYYDNATGEAWELSDAVENIKCSTYRRGRASSAEISFLKHPGFEVNLGSRVTIRVEIEGTMTDFFQGRITKRNLKHEILRSFTLHDQLFYLRQNKQTYNFRGKKATEIATAIISEFGLTAGEMTDTRYVIPNLLEDGQTVLDIITRAVDESIVKEGEIFYLWDDFGKLRISSVREAINENIIGDNSLAVGFEYTEDISTDTYNRIKLVKDNQEKGLRDAYVYEDTDTQKSWGLLQYYEKVADNLNPAQVADRADKLLTRHNKTNQTFSLPCLLDLSFRAGQMVLVMLSELDIEEKYFLLEACEQDLKANTMRLTLSGRRENE